MLDLRRFNDRTFRFSILGNTLSLLVQFGLFFLVPYYLQTLQQQTTLQAGMILAVQASATLVVLPIAGRLSDRVSPRAASFVGLIGLGGAAALLRALELETPMRLVLGILIVFGFAIGFVQQIPVTAMSQVKIGEHKEIANAATLIMVLQAITAPIGVAALAGLVQSRESQFRIVLAAEGIDERLLADQSLLLAMRDSFRVVFFATLLAFAALCLIPRRVPISAPEHSSASLTT